MRTPYITASLIASTIATALGLEDSSDFVVYFDGNNHGSHSYISSSHGHNAAHGSHGYGNHSSHGGHGYGHHSSSDYSDSDHHGHGGYHSSSYSSGHHGHHGGYDSSHTSDGYSLPSSYSYSYSHKHPGGHFGGYTSDGYGGHHLSLTSYSDAIHDSYSDSYYYNPYSELDELEAIIHANLAPTYYDYGYTHDPY